MRCCFAYLAAASIAGAALFGCAEDASERVTSGGGAGAGVSGDGGGATQTTVGAGPASSGAGSGGASMPPAEQTLDDMCARPGVVFCESFEGGWAADWIEDNGDVALVPGAVGTEGATVVELRTYEGRQSSKLLRTFPESEEIYVRFDVQYAADYDNSGGSHGPLVAGSNAPPWGMYGKAGIKPNGSDFFVLNYEPDGTVGAGGEFGFYAYFVNMQGAPGNYWGNLFSSDDNPAPVIVPGQWQCAEQRILLNDPSAMDGEAEFWVDGISYGSFDGFQWRTDPNLMLSTFSLDSYNHFKNGPRPASQPNRVRYDNLVISTQPIGCLSPSP